jgi:hypothetical protein
VSAVALMEMKMTLYEENGSPDNNNISDEDFGGFCDHYKFCAAVLFCLVSNCEF